MKRTLLIISCLLISNFIFAKKRLAVFEFDGNARDQKEKNQAIVNGPILSTDRHGRENMAYQFDGIDDYIELSKGLLNFNNSFSIETYLYSEEPVGSYTDVKNRVRPDIDGTILSIDGFIENSTDFLLLSHSGDSLSSWYNNNLISTWNITKASVHSETIYQKYRHLVLVKDEKKNKIKLYIDGELRAERSIAQKKSSAKHTPIIGMHRWIATDGLIYNNFFFKGKMDYFRIYYRALSRKKVAKMYRKESTAPYKHQYKNEKECRPHEEHTDKINKSIKVYPNPSRGNIFIDANLDIDCKEIRIYNHHGKIVITSAYKNEIKVNSLKPGYYTVVLITPQRNYKRRLVIIR